MEVGPRGALCAGGEGQVNTPALWDRGTPQGDVFQGLNSLKIGSGPEGVETRDPVSTVEAPLGHLRVHRMEVTWE